MDNSNQASLGTLNSAHCPSIIYRFERHHRLPTRKNSLWQIHEGLVRTVTWDDDGRVIVLGYWGVGSVVGYGIDQMDPYDIQPLTAVSVTSISLNSALASSYLLAHQKQTNELLGLLHCHPMDNRLLRFIIWLAQRFGVSKKHGIEVRFLLTHQEIAETLGTNRVTITRLIKQLESNGKLHWSRKRRLIPYQTFDRYGQTP